LIFDILDAGSSLGFGLGGFRLLPGALCVSLVHCFLFSLSLMCWVLHIRMFNFLNFPGFGSRLLIFNILDAGGSLGLISGGSRLLPGALCVSLVHCFCVFALSHVLDVTHQDV